MIIKILKILAIVLVIGLTIISAVQAIPVFTENDLTVYLKDGEPKTVTTVVYDLEGVNMDLVNVAVITHPKYMNIPTHIRDIGKTIIDDNAVRITFEVFVPNSQDIGFHREIMTLNNGQKLNIGISNDVSFIASIKDFFHKDLKIGNKYVNLTYPVFWVFALICISVIIFSYRRLK